MKYLRQYIRRLIIEGSEYSDAFQKMFDNGEILMAVNLASTMGIPMEELPWNVPEDVRASGIESILNYMMGRKKGFKKAEDFEAVLAIAEEVGMQTQQLPWNFANISDYLHNFKVSIFRGKVFSNHKLLKPEEEEQVVNNILQPTGWTLADWKQGEIEEEEMLRKPWV